MTNPEQVYAVVANFLSLEERLRECMECIPYTSQNQDVVSPKFPPIILESCSLTESIFKQTTSDRERHTLRTYAGVLEPDLELSDTTTIFLSHSLRFLRPFRNWQITPPTWWTAYNKLKHDRMGNYEAASYAATVNALAGLHQVSRAE